MSLMDDLGSNSDARRMLVYLVIDTSSSMSGTPIQAVREGIEFLSRELKQTPEAIELVHVCIIEFNSSAKIIMPLSPLNQFTGSPNLRATGGTNMTQALELVEREIDATFRPNTGEVKGDYKPAIFLLTDGMPNDVSSAIRAGDRLKNRPAGSGVGTFLALGCGPNVDANTLQKIAKNVALMEDMNSDNIQAFFKWVTASLSTASRRASRAAVGDDVSAEPEPVPEGTGGAPAFRFEF